MFFKVKGEIKTFVDKENRRDFVAGKSMLTEWLQETSPDRKEREQKKA